MKRTLLRVLALALLAGCERPQTEAAPAPVLRTAINTSQLQVTTSQLLTKPPQPKRATAPLATPLRVRTVRQFAWGEGPTQLGHVLGGEQNPEAPMALDIDALGRVVILDQVNQRLLLTSRDGSVTQLPAPRTAQDLLVTGEHVWLLDRLVDKQLQRIDLTSGAVLQTLKLQGIEEPGAISALWAQHDDLYTEVGHVTMQRLASLQGLPRAPKAVAGRLSPDGSLVLTAARHLPDRVTVVVRKAADAPDAVPLRSLEAVLPLPVAQIVELATDAMGRIWLVADLGDDKVQRRQVLMWPVDSNDAVRGELAAWHGPEEAFRPARIAPNGHLFALGLSSDGMTLQEVAP